MHDRTHTWDVTDLLDLVPAAVATISRRLPAHVDREDLASAGYVALLEASPRAPSGESEARAFLLRRIAGAIRDELRRADGVGRRTRHLLSRMREAKRTLEQVHGRQPTSYEVGQLLGVSACAIDAAAEKELAAAPLPPGEGALDKVASQEASPAALAARRDAERHIQDLLTCLPPQQRQAIFRTIVEEASLADAAAAMQVSVGRVAQLRDAGLKRLRNESSAAVIWAELGM